MALTGSRFKLGLFFLFGIAATVIIVVWLSGGFRERDTVTYVSYFPWSVQGLNEGSSVYYNGVAVGRVAAIDIARDGRLVEVVMKIRADFHIDDTIVATMQITGITGIQVINLSTEPERVHLQPRYLFEPEHPVIPVGEGAIQTAGNVLARMTEVLYQVDFEEISDQLLQLLENTNVILESDRIENLEASIIRNSENLDSLLITYTRLGRNLDRLVLKLDRMAPELAENLDSLVVALQVLSEPVGKLSVQMNEFLVESSEILSSLSALLNILRTDPLELFIRTSGEGVWR